jgi:hypothetical protein
VREHEQEGRPGGLIEFGSRGAVSGADLHARSVRPGPPAGQGRSVTLTDSSCDK